MFTPRSHLAMPVTIGFGILLTIAACGAGTSPAASPGNGSTVSVHSINGKPALVDQNGAALYTNDQDGSQSRCVSSDCTAFWSPLTVPGSTKPTAGSGVTGTIGTVSRPDGSHQVTLDGKPLYTFTFDHGAGKMTGDGFRDRFAGTSFTWHNALTSGGSPAPVSSAPGSGYSGGY